MARMAGATPRMVLDHLGETKRSTNHKTSLNIPVKVKRKTAVVEDVLLMDEFKRLIQDDFPNWLKEFIKMPTCYSFDLGKLHKIEGFPKTGRQMVEYQKSQGGRNFDPVLDKWAEAGQADMAEEEVFAAIERAFKDSPGLLWSGLKTEKLFMVVRRALGFKSNQATTAQFSPQDVIFYELIGVDVKKLSQEVTTLTDQLFPNPALTSLNQQDLLANLTQALRVIKPAHDNLPTDAKQKYRPKLEKHIKDTFRAASSTTSTLTRDQVEASLTRHLINYLDRKDEFDGVQVDRNSSTTFCHEVKSWPQNGNLDSPGLQETLEKANYQNSKWKDVFNHIVGPAADLSSSWTNIGMIHLPNVPNRAELEKRGVEPSDLKFILTKAELEDGQNTWKQDLGLRNLVAKEEEYMGLLGIFIGSHYICFQSQMYDKKKEMGEAVEEAVRRITGVPGPGAVMGLGGYSGGMDTSPGGLAGLKGKELGHIW